MQAALPHLPMLYRLLVVLVALAAVAAEPDPCLDHDYATENCESISPPPLIHSGSHLAPLS